MRIAGAVLSTHTQVQGDPRWAGRLYKLTFGESRAHLCYQLAGSRALQTKPHMYAQREGKGWTHTYQNNQQQFALDSRVMGNFEFLLYRLLRELKLLQQAWINPIIRNMSPKLKKKNQQTERPRLWGSGYITVIRGTKGVQACERQENGLPKMSTS